MIALTLAARLSRQYTRNAFLLALIAVVPLLFITLSYYMTAERDIGILVTVRGEQVPASVWMPDLHGAVMVPITAAFLAGLGGLFVMLEASRADTRLVVAGVPATSVAFGRLLMIAAFAAAGALICIGVTLTSFRPGNLGGFILANILVSLSYGLIGALMALVVGRLGGAYLMLFVPMIDVGIFQDPMFVRRPAGLDESPARVRRDTIHDRFRIHSPG